MPHTPRPSPPPLAPLGRAPTESIGLALGSGGARGLAHIVVLEALDELGVRPAVIAGSSMGALVGAVYASGLPGRDIREFVRETLRARAVFTRKLMGIRVGRLADLLFSGSGNPILLDAELAFDAFMPKTVPETFAALQTPLAVVGADLGRREEVIFDEGPLRPAVAGSIAIPGLFRPVAHAGRQLIDGGIVDPLPFEALSGRADVIVAVDVTVGGANRARSISPVIESLLNATQLMQTAIVTQKLKLHTPAILLRPALESFGVLDFLRFEDVLRAAEPIKEELKRRLEGALIAPSSLRGA